MFKDPVIKPDVLNILCEDPVFDELCLSETLPPPPDAEPEPQPEPQPEPEPERESFWRKVGGFCKKAAKVATFIFNAIRTFVSAVNAYVRYKTYNNPAGCGVA